MPLSCAAQLDGAIRKGVNAEGFTGQVSVQVPAAWQQSMPSRTLNPLDALRPNCRVEASLLRALHYHRSLLWTLVNGKMQDGTGIGSLFRGMLWLRLGTSHETKPGLIRQQWSISCM